MARPAKGSIWPRPGADGQVNYTLRFTALGERRTMPLGAVSRDEAERQLGYVMADVARGTWRPPTIVNTPAEVEMPTFHEFAEEWWVLKEMHLSPNTREDYRWRLESHLLPFFKDHRLDAITFDEIERYVAEKLVEGDLIRAAAAKGEPMVQEYTDKRGRTYKRPMQPLSPRSINMTLTTLGAILERASKRKRTDGSKLIDGNAAKDSDLRVAQRAPRRTYLDTAAQIKALLDAAGELDAKASRGRRHIKRRAMIATLIFAGLRIGELLSLPLDLIDLATGWLVIEDSKTAAGDRKVKVRWALRDELASIKADDELDLLRDDAYFADSLKRLAFPTRTGRQMSAENFRSRVLAPAIKRANENLAKDGLPPLPEGLTPHSLRRTFCSLLYALGEDPGVVMDEMGHTDPELALRVYRQAMRRGDDEKAQLRAVVEGEVLAHKGTRTASSASDIAERQAA
jgi:integrase